MMEFKATVGEHLIEYFVSQHFSLFRQDVKIGYVRYNEQPTFFQSRFRAVFQVKDSEKYPHSVCNDDLKELCVEVETHFDGSHSQGTQTCVSSGLEERVLKLEKGFDRLKKHIQERLP